MNMYKTLSSISQVALEELMVEFWDKWNKGQMYHLVKITDGRVFMKRHCDPIISFDCDLLDIQDRFEIVSL